MLFDSKQIYERKRSPMYGRPSGSCNNESSAEKAAEHMSGKSHALLQLEKFCNINIYRMTKILPESQVAYICHIFITKIMYYEPL